MTADKIWDIYTQRNPKLLDGRNEIAITSWKLRTIINQAYESGYFESHKKVREAASVKLPKGFESIFCKI